MKISYTLFTITKSVNKEVAASENESDEKDDSGKSSDDKSNYEKDKLFSEALLPFVFNNLASTCLKPISSYLISYHVTPYFGIIIPPPDFKIA